jgi:hypothetical protein
VYILIQQSISIMAIVLEIEYFNTIIKAIDRDGMFTGRPDLREAVEESLKSGSFRALVNDRVSYLSDDETPTREVGRTFTSSLSTIFKVCFLFSDSDICDFRRYSASSIMAATMAIDDPVIYPRNDSGGETDSDAESIDEPSCNNPHCLSFSPRRFLCMSPTEDNWFCLQCVESNPTQKLQFMLTNCSPGNGGLDWLVSEPPYSTKAKQQFHLKDDEMWFTIYYGKPFGQFHVPPWPELRFIMKKPIPRIASP